MGGMGGLGGMGGGMGDDSDDEEEESQVEPHLPEGSGIDDLDGEETSDLKKWLW